MPVELTYYKVDMGEIAGVYGPAKVTYLDRQLNVNTKRIDEKFFPLEMITLEYYIDIPPSDVLKDSNKVFDFWNNCLKAWDGKIQELFQKVAPDRLESSEFALMHRHSPDIMIDWSQNKYLIWNDFTVARVDYD